MSPSPAAPRRHRGLAASALLFALAAPARAQSCPNDDAFEPDDACLTAPLYFPPATLSGRAVVDANVDWSSWRVQPGETLVLDVLFSHAIDDIDASLYSSCGTLVAFGASSTDNEHIEIANASGVARDYRLEVELFDASGCNDYSVQGVVLPPPACFAGNDAFEPNDSCLQTPLLPNGTTNGLGISPGDDDWFRLQLVPGDEYLIDAAFQASMGNIDLELWTPDCSILLDDSRSVGNFEQGLVRNVSDQVVPVALRVFSTGTLCTDYSLTVGHFLIGDPCNSLLDDTLEPNGTCGPSAPLLPAGTYNGLRVLSPDVDWYRFSVPATSELTVVLNFVHAAGDLQLAAFDAATCTMPNPASLGTGNSETMRVANPSAAPITAAIKVWLQPGGPTSCNDYSLVASVAPYVALQPYCYGDGSGTACPCGNADVAHPAFGGCSNVTGRGARLVASGTPSVMTDTLRFDFSFGPLGSFAVLVAGNNALAGGLGLQAFDGLRCVGGELQRHGTRAISAAGTTNPWGFGGGPAGGLAAHGGYVAGQRRHFQVFYRTNPVESCGNAQNTTNAIRVDFVP